MSVCAHCNKLGEFYECSPRKCKECIKTQVRKYRSENIEKVRAYDRGRSNLPHRVSARREYAKSEGGKIATARGSGKWAARNPLKRKAQVAVSNALRDGRLLRGPCEVCGELRVDGHHDDYSKPLSVRWLCRSHHMEWHKSNRVR